MIILLHGQDDFRSRRALKEIKERFKQETDQAVSDIVELDGEKLTVSQLSEALGSNSMFSRKRMVIIDQLFRNKKVEFFEQALPYLKDQVKSDTVLLIIDDISFDKKRGGKKAKITKDSQSIKKLFDFLSKQEYSQEFKKLTIVEVGAFLKKELIAKGVVMTNDAQSLLIALTGGDLRQIDHELEKLIAFSAAVKKNEKEEQKIDSAMVKDLVKGIFQEKVFELTDAISERNKAKAVRLLEEDLLAGQTIEEVFSLIVRQFRILLLVRQAVEIGNSPSQIASDLGLHPFVVQKSIQQAKNYNLEALKNIFSSLVKLEYLWKSGQIDPLVGLTSLIVKL